MKLDVYWHTASTRATADMNDETLLYWPCSMNNDQQFVERNFIKYV